MDLKKIGECIASLRNGRNMTQMELGNALNVSDKTISKWENGNGLPDIESLMKLASFFGITVDEILRAGEGTTEYILILDKSGSMHDTKSDVVGGVNSVLSKQKALEGKANMSIILFDTNRYVLHDSRDIKTIKEITHADYEPSGSTAFYDAVGETIDEHLKKTPLPKKVVMIIWTDGLENASRTYSKSMIRNKIEYLKKELNWEIFIYGTNFDVDRFSDEIAIEKNRRVNYVQDSEGTISNFNSIDKIMSSYRSTGRIDDDWDKDVKKRDKKE